MPDASGKFKGIAVPELPWVKDADAPHPDALSVMTCINPNCKFCAPPEQERQDS